MTGFDCPFPIADYPRVVMAHGGGGRLMHQLLDGLILPILQGDSPHAGADAACLTAAAAPLAFTTDAFVVTPLEFAGGDIGELAVYGTVNDLAMAGAEPRWLSLALIIEEGFAVERLARLLCSARRAADRCGVAIVAGDTKVVERGKADGLYFCSSGVGLCRAEPAPAPQRIRPGDAVLVSGDLGRHGVALLAQREGLAFETPLCSDCAPVHGAVLDLLARGLQPHALRDLTRGGLASALNELATAAGVGIELDEAALPVCEAVAAACELLGLDPCAVACEGRFVCILPEEEADAALDVLAGHAAGPDARPARIGRVCADARPPVRLRTRYGSQRALLVPSGEQLPRIC